MGQVVSLASQAQLPLLMLPISAVLALAVPVVSLVDSPVDFLLAHLQLLMLPISAVLALAVPVASLVDSPEDSQLDLPQLLMLLTLAVSALVAQDLVVPDSAAPAVSALAQHPKLSAPQDKAHQPQKQKLPQLTSLTNPRSPDEQESKFGKHDTPVHAF